MAGFVGSFMAWLARFSGRTTWAAGSILLGVLAGVGSASYSLSQSGLSPPRSLNGWQEWNLSTESPFLPYALGHFLSAGQLPPSRASRQFVRRTDDQGRKLSSVCPVIVRGNLPKARWWTLAAAALNGKVASDEAIADAGSAIREADGKLMLTVSEGPQPGNWIAPANRGGYMLVLTVHDPAGDVTELDMLSVTQEAC